MVQIENETAFAAQLEQLRSLGFLKQSQNLKLLKRTNGNVEVVAKFLEAKKLFRDASEKDRLEKKALRKELKNIKKRGHDDSEEIKAHNKEFKEEKKRLKKSIEKAEDSEKHEKKQLKKAEKLAQRLAKLEAKKLKKEQKGKICDEDKAKKRDQKRAEKKAQKEARNKELEAFVLPENITTVFLDGNNMLFVLSSLRARVLKRNMREAEQMLEMMAKSWCDANPQLKTVTLIFDDTQTAKFSERFNVCSARPHFPTSDDALVYWCKNAITPEKSSIAVFTSDQALGDELAKSSVNVYKSKVWFHLAAKTLKDSDDENNNSVADTTENGAADKPAADLDDWASDWLAKHFEKMNV